MKLLLIIDIFEIEQLRIISTIIVFFPLFFHLAQSNHCYYAFLALENYICLHHIVRIQKGLGNILVLGLIILFYILYQKQFIFWVHQIWPLFHLYFERECSFQFLALNAHFYIFLALELQFLNKLSNYNLTKIFLIWIVHSSSFEI